MTQQPSAKSPEQKLHEIKQWVPQEFCVGECRGCCKFMESYWLPHVLVAEAELVGYRSIGLVQTGTAMTCQFLEPTPHHCRIYARRPFECRLYPFLLTRRQDTLDLVAHQGCPFVTRELGTQKFKEYCQYLTGLFRGSAVRALLRQEADRFHTYPDVELYLIQRDVIRQPRSQKP